MGGPYLAAVWPFYAFIPVLIARFVGRSRSLLAGAFCCALAISAGMRVQHARWANSFRPDPSALLEDAGSVVVDNVARGIFPRIFWHLPENKPVFAADQAYLLEHRDAWLARAGDGGLFISELSYGNTPERQQAIIELIRESYGQVAAVEGGVLGVGDAFKIGGQR